LNDWVAQQLEAAIRGGTKPLIVCGAGTSTYATDGRAPSWYKLLNSGIQRVVDIDAREATWAAYARHRLSENILKDWLTVGDELTERLGGKEGAELSTWLLGLVGNLETTKTDLYDAIFRLGCPVATTNYDKLLTKHSGRNAISWTDPNAAVKVIRGDIDSILHLHGIVDDPKSIILGNSSYIDIVDSKINNIVRTFQSLGCETLFIGCSQDGLQDPDFSNIAKLLDNMSAAKKRKFWLVKTGYSLPKSNSDNDLLLVEYGDSYDCLPRFLSNLPELDAKVVTSGNSLNEAASIDIVEPKPLIFGRDDELKKVVNSILAGGHALVSGAPGIGKTALAVSCAYDAKVREKFGRFRFFVSLENQTEPRSILSSTAFALGLPTSGDNASLLRQIHLFATKNPLLVIIDNAEDAFSDLFLEAETILKLLCQIDGLSVILTKRDMLPIISNAASLGVLDKLDNAAATETFITMSGLSPDTNDEALKSLIEALDGHALSLQLIAAQARTVRNLADILQEWRQQRALLLKRRGQDEGRLTSVRASLAISVKNKRLSADPLARRLLTMLSELPDGLNEKDCSSLLSQSSIVSKERSKDALRVLRDLNLVEERPDSRVRMLNPLRESVKLDLPISSKDAVAIIRKYEKTLTPMLKINPPSNITREIDAEYLNVESACRLAIVHYRSGQPLHQIIVSYVKYLAVSGGAVDRIWERSAKRFADSGDFVAAVDILHRLGYVEFIRGNTDKAKVLYLKALPYARNIGKSAAVGSLYDGLANCVRHEGDVTEAKRLYDLAIQHSKQSNPVNTIAIGNSLNGLGHIGRMTGDTDYAKEMFDQAFVVHEASNDVVGMANATAFSRQAGSPDRLSSINRALELIGPYKFSASKNIFLILLGDYWYRRGEADKSLDAYKQAQLAAREGAHAMNEAQAQIRSGQAMIAAGRHNSGINEVLEGFNLWFSTSASKTNTFDGFQSIKEGLIAMSPMAALSHFSQAAESWKKIGRLDLIEDWINFQFGSEVRK
jgi:tetratricopeptide (TPR) repeat protein